MPRSKEDDLRAWIREEHLPQASASTYNNQGLLSNQRALDIRVVLCAMANLGFVPEGHSIHRLPYFNGSNYSYWKNHMHIFLRAQNYEIWKVVSNGPYTLPEDEGKWTKDNIKKSQINFSAMNIMQCAIHPDEYSHVSMCISVKDMWDKLKLIYEGTSEVKETKVNILLHEYEMFKMSPVESIFDMFARLSKITNGLKTLGKNYTDIEIVRKILRSLPPA
ncbi:hypothetical protein Taro_030545 [Colocasia esculenta]|uniref:DUF4219 domain-containing protein n=1 Tax=Colocasia esculenta TaxID=4460 RepID=A0A843W0I7_COLES|nr:hypothetical protein [Colocasia esculenta]